MFNSECLLIQVLNVPRHVKKQTSHKTALCSVLCASVNDTQERERIFNLMFYNRWRMGWRGLNSQLKFMWRIRERERERKTQSVLALGSGRESGGGERERDRKGEVKKEREIIIEKRGEETPSFKKFWKKVFEFFAQVVP